MAIASALTLYVLKLSKEILKDYQGIMDKLQCKLEAKSLFEELKYIMAVSPFESSYVKNTTSIGGFPKELSLTGKLIKIEAENGTISLYDTGSKINALYLSRNTVRKLFQYVGLKTNKADIAFDSYEDWKDKDDLKRLNGAESYYYRFEKGYNYGPRNNSAIQSMEELKCIRGFQNSYEKIKNYLTFYYRGSLLNINTASPEILSMVLNISKDQAEQILSLRKRKKAVFLSDVESILGKKYPFFYEFYSVYPSRVVEIHIKVSKGLAEEKLEATVDFKPNKNYPFSIIKYVE